MSSTHFVVGRCLAIAVIAAFAVACGGSNKAASGAMGAPGADAGANGTDGGTGGGLPPGCDPIDPTYAGFGDAFFRAHCRTCHSAANVGDARVAPPGVDFDTEMQIAFLQARIRVRAVEARTMPPGAPLSDCEAAQLASYLDALGGAGACVPDCAGKTCGDDGCSGNCGECAAGLVCQTLLGTCDTTCTPACAGVACGDDGCGGSCGECGPGLACSLQGQCGCAPDCAGKTCGDDGCGGSCGECAGGVCSLDGACVCLPDCTGVECGDNDGCGGSCGECPALLGEACNVAGSCECAPIDCTGRACGPNGCGGTCGAGCPDPPGPAMLFCNTRSGKCVSNCQTDCAGRDCGDDGCGGSCGDCSGAAQCTIDGTCECIPDCVGRVCGDDGCGTPCGTCASGLACGADGQCGCTSSCAGRECGSDGCGGDCGGCGAGESCSAGQCVTQCTPACGGKACGDDGCGGVCGSCAAGQDCSGGQCVWPSVSFANDVYPIFQTHGCAGMGCHGGAAPAEGLDLSSSSKALATLVDVASGQCANKKRVASGDPTASYLVNKLTGSGLCFGTRMPKTGAALSTAEIDTVRAWIAGL